MKHLLELFLVCLLLCGCSREVSAEEPVHPTQDARTIFETAPKAAYDPGSPLEVSTNGAVKVYPLHIENTYFVMDMDGGLVVFSGAEETTLTVLTGEDLFVSSSRQLDFRLDPQDPSLWIRGKNISFFHPLRQETLVLNDELEEITAIAAPSGLSGVPILSDDLNTLYYCTASAVRAWDLESGIRRTIKEMSWENPTVKGLHLGNTVLKCTATDNARVSTLFLDAQTGQQLHIHEGEMAFTDSGARYFAAFPTGSIQMLLYGENSSAPRALNPSDITASCVFLKDINAAVTVSCSAGESLILEYYDLQTGLRCAELTLPSGFAPLSILEENGNVALLLYDPAYGCMTVYRWDPTKTPVHDQTIYTGTYYTCESPDLAGIARCQTYAREIGNKYGIDIRIWEDAAAVQPWDYKLEPEYLVPVIWQELTLLDERLSQYPSALLAATGAPFTGFHICIVRDLAGTAESGSLTSANGLQFVSGTDAYLVIAAGQYSGQALYHELFHVMETYILNNSIAFDQWNKLNPTGFKYDYDYQANAKRDSGVYLQAENRAFIDTYSMSFPKEDRARIMEYAMLPGNRDLFRSEILQAKLLAVCKGIREAYGLEKSSEIFLWEQYLEKPLARTK